MTDYLLRSLMFVPAHNERLLDSSLRTDADVLLLDLEDSVQPAEYKDIARKNIVRYLESGAFKNRQVFPRVNDRESGELLHDITTLALPGIDGFVYPKAKTGQDIYFFDKLLETVEYEQGIEIGTFKIIALIETASAVLHAEEIAKASPRVIAIAFGNEDFLTDIQGENDEAASPLFTARSLISMAAHSAGVAPIDTVHIKVHDLEDLEYNLKIASKLGFQGQLVLHPKELPLVHRYFSPTDQEVNEAEEMVEAFKQSEREGVGVAIVNGKFVGPPLVRNAEKILRRKKLIDQK
ncbi:MAG TPA: CoA ester lyase [Bacillota bacterium]|nr:CoA ester lyase [Bacillota bacterium]